MGIVLGANQYGKAENRVVRIVRDTAAPRDPRPQRVDVAARRLRATRTPPATRRRCCRPTPRRTPPSPTPRSTAIDSPEDYALALGGRLLEATPGRERRAGPGRGVRLGPVIGRHDHSFVRRGGAVRTCVVTVGRDDDPRRCPASRTSCVLNSTDSEFKGFLKDEFTTLPETDDRILATSLVAKWRHATAPTSTGTRRTTRSGDCCSRPSPRRTPARSRRRCTRWARAVLDDPAGDRRDQVLGAQQAPLPRRLLRVRRRGADQRRRGLHRRGPALRPDRGAGEPRRRAAGRRRVAARRGVLLMAVETTREVLLGCLVGPALGRRRPGRSAVRRPGRAHRRGRRGRP